MGSGGVAGPFGYKGQWGCYTDSESGLVLMGHRFYDTATGRFLTRDPMGYAGGINLYAYCKNNPVNLMDPSGLWSLYIGLGVSGTLFSPLGTGSVGFVFDFPTNGPPAVGFQGSIGGGFGLGLGYSKGLDLGFSNSGSAVVPGESSQRFASAGYAQGGGFNAGVSWPYGDGKNLNPFNPDEVNPDSLNYTVSPGFGEKAAIVPFGRTVTYNTTTVPVATLIDFFKSVFPTYQPTGCPPDSSDSIE